MPGAGGSKPGPQDHGPQRWAAVRRGMIHGHYATHGLGKLKELPPLPRGRPKADEEPHVARIIADAVTLRPKVIRTCLQIPPATIAVAVCKAIAGLAPPCGITAEKRRSGMPKLSMKSSAVPLTIPMGIMPSMSLGERPASSIARNDDAICNSNAVLVDPRS